MRVTPSGRWKIGYGRVVSGEGRIFPGREAWVGAFAVRQSKKENIIMEKLTFAD